MIPPMSIQLRIAHPGQAALGRSQEDWGGERVEPPQIPLPENTDDMVDREQESSVRVSVHLWSENTIFFL